MIHAEHSKIQGNIVKVVTIFRHGARSVNKHSIFSLKGETFKHNEA
jgi:hypothetical protein